MTYLSGRADQRKKIFRYALYGVVFLLIVIYWGNIKSTFYPIVEPFAVAYANVKKDIGNISTFVVAYTTTRETLISRDKELLVMIERLENELQEKNAKLEEAQRMIGEDANPKTTLVMYPLMQDITRLYSTILLSKGFKEGVEVGDYVYIRKLQPVCIIEEVYPNTSRCQLLSASGVATDAVIQGSSTVSFSLVGRGGGTFLANVPRDTAVRVGDSVYLRSDPSLQIGSVVDVIHNDQDTSWHVFVRGMYNPVTSSIFYLHK